MFLLLWVRWDHDYYCWVSQASIRIDLTFTIENVFASIFQIVLFAFPFFYYSKQLKMVRFFVIEKLNGRKWFKHTYPRKLSLTVVLYCFSDKQYTDNDTRTSIDKCRHSNYSNWIKYFRAFHNLLLCMFVCWFVFVCFECVFVYIFVWLTATWCMTFNLNVTFGLEARLFFLFIFFIMCVYLF